MSDLEVQPGFEPAGASPGLSQVQRVTYTFSSPSKTFDDIKRGNRSWWLPYVIMVLVSYALFAAITMKVGWAQVAENAIHLNPKSEERLAQAPPESRATAMKFTQYSMEGGFAATPILILIIVALGALVLWGTINFVFGGKATFGSIFTVWMYAGLPGLIKTILGVVVLFTGGAPETFNLANFAPTNVGSFLPVGDTNPALYRLATALDFTTIWTMILMGIGLSIVAGVKRSSGYIAVFGWWALLTLIGVGYAAVTG